MRKTIKSLEEEISRLEESKNRWYNEARDLKEEKERKDREEMFSIKEEVNSLKAQTRDLLEIIRWQINPETAKFPFVVDKEQRNERSKF